jgi:hypothetical protein
MIQCGIAPFLECSSVGDKRFSAFHARISTFGYRSIEEVYQASKIFEDGSTGLGWREAKAKQRFCPIINREATRMIYTLLWRVYIAENIDLLEVLKQQSGLSDIYGIRGHVCQAWELWRIRKEFT